MFPNIVIIDMGKIKVLELSEAQRLALTEGFRQGGKHCFRMRCRAVLLKAEGLSLAAAGRQTEMSNVSVNSWVKRFQAEGIKGLETRPRTRAEGHHGLYGRRGGAPRHRTGQVVREQGKGSVAASHQQEGERHYVQAFFFSALAQDINV